MRNPIKNWYNIAVQAEISSDLQVFSCYTKIRWIVTKLVVSAYILRFGLIGAIMLSNFLSEDTSDTNEINTPIIKVRDRTLIFVNSIYQISNISSLRLLNLSTVQPFPQYIVWLILVGLVTLFIAPDSIKIFGILMVAYGAWKFFEYSRNKLRIRHGLKISMNSGEKPIIINSDAEFLKRIMLVLCKIINNDEPIAYTFNLDQRQISQDKSINIDSMSGSNFVRGDVVGDVVNNV